MKIIPKTFNTTNFIQFHILEYFLIDVQIFARSANFIIVKFATEIWQFLCLYYEKLSLKSKFIPDRIHF
ncbi:hypothetical protein CEP14_01345 [Cylindrospermopsis raciborskii C04]|uniref:Uncharacterized protein n=1 Tax=Cylindrospermopsis raciborskii CS-505 TaxID=533240 RepID=A0A853ME24_9CYAN|nr:hypothetical protein A9P98_11050 [Cylindrospermopsis raciborskii CS-505]PNJ97297.1 hypothetical protein CEP13_03175 [Cylindrospermopsis raciborskii C03]PNJ99264.1 hypothetical protein CEP14_01345 [Cylindrospermopsis raciborskii C04]PNK17960.1 hypothetical protein CEP09_00200 [Cylindrospermopsis raciborskii S06]PNK20656.1 hypothetical protein CEP08_00835 [Cylindrospermopsis raciborskii S05]